MSGEKVRQNTVENAWQIRSDIYHRQLIFLNRSIKVKRLQMSRIRLTFDVRSQQLDVFGTAYAVSCKTMTGSQ